MHKIFELRDMDVEQLHNLASELNIKGFKKMEKDDLVYAILDEEARHNAQNAPEKPAKAKRGRPRKNEVNPVKAEEKPVAEPVKVEEKPEAKPQSGKKRGRKPKIEAPAAEVAEVPVQEVKTEEVKEEKVNEVMPQQPRQPKQPKQKRNRIQKGNNNNPEQAKAEETAEKPAEKPVEQPVEIKSEAEEKKVENTDAPAQENNRPQQNHNHNQNGNNNQHKPAPIEFDGVVEATGVLEIMPDK